MHHDYDCINIVQWSQRSVVFFVVVFLFDFHIILHKSIFRPVFFCVCIYTIQMQQVESHKIRCNQVRSAQRR